MLSSLYTRLDTQTSLQATDFRLSQYVDDNPQYLKSKVVPEVRNLFLSEAILLDALLGSSMSLDQDKPLEVEALVSPLVQLMRRRNPGIEMLDTDLTIIFTRALNWALDNLTEETRKKDLGKWIRAINFLMAFVASTAPSFKQDKGWKRLFPEIGRDNYLHLIKLALLVCSVYK
eukprot:GHVQ01013233.1.p1 GENE.GHVQ01013233.1~~GHVQ01013233.1.p1  ORF type:complete len:174 (-),score=11.10 GHVQ01013233.1:34-555(-)